MKISVRDAVKADASAALRLINELAEYENAPEEVEVSLAEFEECGFGEKPLYHLKVAETETGEVIGIALYYIGYSTWKGKLIYLDDLVVTKAWRRKGVGKKLLSQLFKLGQEMGVRQIRWHVLDWNTPAIDLYKQLNAQLEAEWITCKFGKKEIAENANI